jgi:hypothetical protein
MRTNNHNVYTILSAYFKIKIIIIIIIITTIIIIHVTSVVNTSHHTAYIYLCDLSKRFERLIVTTVYFSCIHHADH